MNRSNILVVDDEEKMRLLLQLYLEENNYIVNLAESGIEALESIEAKQPDLIILDVFMPEMNGPEVCRHIRQNKKYSHIPVIFLNSMNGSDADQDALHMGDDVVTKPFDPNELVEKVNAILRRIDYVGAGIEYLTNQEREILQLMNQGLTNKEIAMKLHLTEGTVKVYNYVIYQKLQVRNRTQAVIRAKELKII